MSDALIGVVIGGAIGVITALVTVAGAVGIQRMRHRHERELAHEATKREQRNDTARRLRELYADVLEFALSYPDSHLGYQLQTLRQEDEVERAARLQAYAARVNGVRARLRIEPDPRSNHDVLVALITVVTASDLYSEAVRENRANPGPEGRAEMGRKQRLLSEAFEKLEHRCREHIEAVESETSQTYFPDARPGNDAPGR